MCGNWHLYDVFLPIPYYPLIVPAPRPSHQRWPQALAIAGYMRFYSFICINNFKRNEKKKAFLLITLFCTQKTAQTRFVFNKC